MERPRSNSNIDFGDIEVRGLSFLIDENPEGSLTIEKLKQAMLKIEPRRPAKMVLHDSFRNHPDYKDDKNIIFVPSPLPLDKGFMVDGDFFDGYSISQHPMRSNIHDDFIDAFSYAMQSRKLNVWQASIIKIKMLVSRFLKSISLKNVVRAIIYLLITLAMVALLNGSSLVV